MAQPLLRVALPLAALAALAALAGPAGADPVTPTLPAYGAFVIGDGSNVLNAQVTFWGAQWWKNNDVSKGSAPPAFKGFADGLATGLCGQFTTDTGDSSNPPDGPLPPYMIALVTDSVDQTGSTVSGDVVALAVIATDEGYDTDPGHAGTGTVVGLIPCAEL